LSFSVRLNKTMEELVRTGNITFYEDYIDGESTKVRRVSVPIE